MFGLFMMPKTERFARLLEGESNPSIHIFKTEGNANKWLLEKLLAAEIVSVSTDGNDGYVYDDDAYATEEELLEAVRGDLESDEFSEFMHVYPAVDHRNP